MATKKSSARTSTAKKRGTARKPAGTPESLTASAPLPAAGLRKTKRASLRLTDEDFNRLRWEILTKEKYNWNDLLTVSVNEWLEKKGYARLEEVE